MKLQMQSAKKPLNLLVI